LTPPAVPFAEKIKDGEIVKIECVDWTGGQIGNNDSADDVKNIDLTTVHYLSGPFEIENAQPGDVLVVEIQDVQPFQEQPWGFTGVFDKDNGGGFLDEIYPHAYVLPLFMLQLQFTDPANPDSAPKLSGTLRASSAPVGTYPVFASPVSFIQGSSAALPAPRF
jgi:acetamidase/formamidase